MKFPSDRLKSFFTRELRQVLSSGHQEPGGFGKAFKHVIAAVLILKLAGVGAGIGLGTVRQVQINTAGPTVAYTMSETMAQTTATAALDVATAVKYDPRYVKANADWQSMSEAQQVAVLEDVQHRFLKHFTGVPDLPLQVGSLPGAYGMVDNAFGMLVLGAPMHDVSLHAHLDRDLLFGPKSTFEKAVNTTVHESMHVVQMSWLARAVVDQLKYGDKASVDAIVGMMVDAKDAEAATMTREKMIAALEPLASKVAPPAGVATDLQRFMTDFSDPVRRIMYGYYLNAGEQQSFKVADVMTQTSKLSDATFQRLGEKKLREAFITAAITYRPGNAFGPARTVYPKVVKKIDVAPQQTPARRPGG